VNSWPIESLIYRLNGLLLTLKRCKGRACTRPWEKLHPDGSVRNLKDAMDAKYDAFYAERQYPVTFSECALGQVLATEGALEPVVWQAEWDKWSYET
jgi:N-acetylglucosamine-6-sulfatase